MEPGGETKVYLDYNATTPLAPEVLHSINVALRDFWGNPSSSHDAGVKANRAIREARASVGRMVNADPSDIVFTSGGTESNNMLFHTIASLPLATGSHDHRPHVVISNLEHDSVDLPARALQKQGAIDLTIVPADVKTGKVCPNSIVSALRPNTRLVSLMLANNETGILQPVRGVMEAVRAWEQRGGRGEGEQRVLVHTDAAQALGKVPVDVEALGVDYLTIVGHKFYGPRIGALFVRGLDAKETPLLPMLHGGGQERGYRSGTENTGMVAGLGTAAELVADHVVLYGDHMRQVRDYLEEQLQKEFGALVTFNGRNKMVERIPNTCNVSFIGKPFTGNHVLSLLKYSQASVGAACHSNTSSKASPVLLACGVAEPIALNALRISVGRETTKTHVDIFIRDIKESINTLSEALICAK